MCQQIASAKSPDSPGMRTSLCTTRRRSPARSVRRCVFETTSEQPITWIAGSGFDHRRQVERLNSIQFIKLVKARPGTRLSVQWWFSWIISRNQFVETRHLVRSHYCGYSIPFPSIVHPSHFQSGSDPVVFQIHSSVAAHDQATRECPVHTLKVAAVTAISRAVVRFCRRSGLG